jgi:Gluconolactonase
MMRKTGILFLILLLLGSFGLTVEAETGVRYRTFTTTDDRLVTTQTAYQPISSTRDINGVPIGEPLDIHITSTNIMYIATIFEGSGRIIRFDLSTGVLDEFGKDFLTNPTGVFATEDGTMYVADRSNRAVYQMNTNGVITQTYVRPDSPLFGAEDFQPRKVVVDARGNLYVLNLGIRGLAQFANTGDFLGYYGANTITPTLRTILQFTFFTEEQRARLFNIQPPELSNMAIDQRGLIHTVSLGVENFGVKRLNISGGNLLPEMINAPDLVGVAVGPIGNIYVITQSGRLYEYDREGNLLFLFGGQDVSNQIEGLLNTPTGIAVDSSFNLYVIDRASQELTVYQPTVFANKVHDALNLYQDGNYIDALQPWQEVLKMNDFFDLAHRGLGNAYFSLGQYEAALEEYRIANDREGYSNAFWEVRNQWLLDNGAVLFGTLFAFLFVLIINGRWPLFGFVTVPLKRFVRALRTRVKFVDDFMYQFYYLRNPADASFEVKRKNRVSSWSISLLLLMYFGFYLYYIYSLNFLFNPRDLSLINLSEEIVTLLLPILLWVVANYLIGSIRDGEGRLKDVYATTVYSLSPFFLSLPVLTIMSNGMTFNEVFLYQFLLGVAVLLSAGYFFFMVKEIHFYNVKETFQSIAISGFTMVMMLLSVFIVYILLNEILSLGIDITTEVSYRVFNR